MSEHYTLETVEVKVWCRVCRQPTMHRVDGGRRGPCLEHAPKEKPKPVPQSGNLFGPSLPQAPLAVDLGGPKEH